MKQLIICVTVKSIDPKLGQEMGILKTFLMDQSIEAGKTYFKLKEDYKNHPKANVKIEIYDELPF